MPTRLRDPFWLGAVLYDQLLERSVVQSHPDTIGSAQMVVWPEGALAFDLQVTKKASLRQLAVSASAHLVVR